MSPGGWNTTGNSGSKALTGWMTICGNSSKEIPGIKRRRRSMSAQNTKTSAQKISATSGATTEPSKWDLVMTRVFDAPRELVFRVWTDTRHMARWWGPKGFTNPVCEMDVRPGGALRIVMRAPDGVDYPMRGVFREIVEPERLVFTNIALDEDGNAVLEGLTTVTFAEHGGKTKLTLQTSAVGLAAEAAEKLEGMEEGWTQSLERLGELV